MSSCFSWETGCSRPCRLLQSTYDEDEKCHCSGRKRRCQVLRRQKVPFFDRHNNSKYALSERLFCGDCGSPYKRVTWNIHGRKQIVWRCVNRIEYGTKFCGNSPSIPEEELHRAILKAIQGLAAIETRFIGGYKKTMQLT